MQHLAHMMLVQALRAHLAEGLSGGVGWLFALADRADGPAIHAMHGDPRIPGPCRNWRSVSGCRDRASPQKFKETVGATPIDYLTRWRMLLAGDRLANSSDPDFRHLAIARLRIRKRLQHGIQEGHGLFAEAI